MSLSRRAFVRSLGLGGASALSTAFVIGRGQEALAWGPDPLESFAQSAMSQAMDIRISSNENPRGPSQKALDVMSGKVDLKVGRYNREFARQELPAAIAKLLGHGAKAENVLISTGSSGILEAAARAYLGPSRPLVTGAPSYGNPVRTATLLGAESKLIPVDAEVRLDLDAMADVSKGAGLVFLCNPNNPTSTAHSADTVAAIVDRIKTSSPDTAILIDEAYIDYATDTTVASGTPQALEHSDVFIARTFSKAYGMAGLRLGYAAGQPGTLEKLAGAWGLGEPAFLVAAAGIAAVEDTAHMDWERGENARVRQFTIDAFADMGFEAGDSQTNFLFVNIGRTAKEFRDACAERGVRVGRDFPPMEKTHARVSIGTMEEMERAVGVFREVLGVAAMSSASRG